MKIVEREMHVYQNPANNLVANMLWVIAKLIL